MTGQSQVVEREVFPTSLFYKRALEIQFFTERIHKLMLDMHDLIDLISSEQVQYQGELEDKLKLKNDFTSDQDQD